MNKKKVYRTDDVKNLVKEGTPAIDLLELAGKNVERDLDRGFELIMNSLEKIRVKFPDATFVFNDGHVGIFLGDAYRTSYRIVKGYTGSSNIVQQSILGYENNDLNGLLYEGDLRGCENILGEDDDKEFIM